MPKGLQKSLQIYISKLKKATPQSQKGPSHPTTSWLLSACKYPKTPSFAVDRDHSNSRDNAATLTDIDRFLFENFNSLYTQEHNNEIHDTQTKNVYTSNSATYINDIDIDTDDGCDKTMIMSDSTRFLKTPPNLRSSQRFFASPCTSNSLLEEAQSSRSASDDMAHTLPGESIALLTYSHDPYDDFRQSMQEMVDAHQVDQCQPLDWDYMEDLLFCYLNLNEKRAHKYILGAFVDMMISFRQQDSGKVMKSVHKIPSTRERRRKVVEENADIIFRERADVDCG
ncbi:transcription repressor OFP14 [Magnolia sinica]|uniref:transcription repressor OFP14 n=1 Tax=Magnolia sinica TaxID=86752 RepID=UPI00265A294C|nr:transcription repressor OFP14 [Magnolia sinica]